MNEFQSAAWEDTAEEQKMLGKSNFMLLQEGDNTVRILGNYVFRNVHYVQSASEKYIICCGEGCPVCATGNKPGLNYYINVLDRADETVKILRFGTTVKRKIQNIHSKFGDVAAFDVIITRVGKDLNTSYEVLPSMKSKDITASLAEKIKTEMTDLNVKFAIPSAADIVLKMQPAEEQSNNFRGKSESSKHTAHTQPAAQSLQQAAAVQSQTVNTVSKACFGIKFNPMNSECQTCTILDGCRVEVMKKLEK